MFKDKGFTLIELIITLGIVAILVVIASVVYNGQVRKARRADAINVILSIVLAEERYRSTHTTYGDLSAVWGGVTASPAGYYTLSISNVAGGTYTVTATAVGNQANDAENGTSCTPISFAMSNGTATKSPAACWPS